MAGVVGRARVKSYPLHPFSESEARLFIDERRKGASEEEVARALARSGCNARVLAYLIDTWEGNVTGVVSNEGITVEEIIAQKCSKIFEDLHIAAWPNSDIEEFFAAISLLPPPIPLDELAAALGWSSSQVNSAASDLAPMLEIIPQGAIFRDEPTETYVRDTYSREVPAQQSIAQRLEDQQATSEYAAEALPGFLVAINDSGRAYALANSSAFPKSLQSDYGKRRLALVRLHAAFRLAVKEGDLDRALQLATTLSQVAAANARGDEFIRRSPSLAVRLGDRDVSRRLFNDRSGWRGARDSRLTLAYSFGGEIEEARLHRGRTIGWINWYHEGHGDENYSSDAHPDAFDFAAVIFLAILEGGFRTVDDNLCRWNDRFSISVCEQVIRLARQHECLVGSSVMKPLTEFASGKDCCSYALKIALLCSGSRLERSDVRAIARGVARSQELT